jgi:hypothetical protein
LHVLPGELRPGTQLVATKYSWDAIAASTLEVYADAGVRPKKKSKPKGDKAKS